eukprot:8116251-Ditylum_brightwellii.AAC.1
MGGNRGLFTKEEPASPTISLEAVLLTSIIEAKEGQDIAMTNIPVAYLSADIDEKVIMAMEGKLAELMVQTDPDLYQKYLGVGGKNTSILYVKLRKTLYGCLKSALLFYNKLEGNLKELVFK